MEIMIIPGTIIFIAGVIFIGIGFKHQSMNDTSQTNWIPVKGQIVQIRKHRNWGGKMIFTPIVLFYTVQGQQLYCEGFGSQLPTYSPNQFVEVSYNPNNTSQAQIKKDSGKKFVRIIFWSVGTLMLLMGFIKIFLAFVAIVLRLTQ